MKPNSITFGSAPLTDAEADSLNATYLDDSHYDEDGSIPHEPTDVFKENGELLLSYRPGALSDSLCAEVLPALRRAAKETHNRELAADGTVLSGIVGYYDPYPRWPYCRLTAFTRDDADGWRDVLRLIYRMDAVYRQALPGRHAVQRKFVEVTSRDFRIEGTAFTTATVNRNQRFKAHRDKGNLKLGTVVMSVPRAVGFTGCRFCMPKYKVGVTLREGDVILFDGDEYHGNTAIVPTRDDYERISVVCYYRSAMIRCGTAEAELEKAKRRKPGDPLR